MNPIKILFIGFVFSVVIVNAEPLPDEVATTVSNYWMSSDFSSLETYVTNLYASYSNYVPAILASSFYDYIFHGDLPSSTNKIAAVWNFVNSSSDSYSDEFVANLQWTKTLMEKEASMHALMGTSLETLQSNASPSAVKSTWGDAQLPFVDVLFYAPATNIVSSP